MPAYAAGLVPTPQKQHSLTQVRLMMAQCRSASCHPLRHTYALKTAAFRVSRCLIGLGSRPLRARTPRLIFGSRIELNRKDDMVRDVVLSAPVSALISLFSGNLQGNIENLSLEMSRIHS